MLKENTWSKKNKVKLGYGPRSAAIWAVLSVSNLMALIDKDTSGEAELRNILPEPFDWFNHAGNFMPSMMVGILTTYTAAKGIDRINNFGNEPTRRIALGLGVSAVAAVNIIAETRWGITNVLNHTPDMSTADNIDIAYGVGAGTFAASLVKVEPAKPETNRHQGYF